MSANTKAKAAWHGARCNGECCRHNRHLGVCPHYRVCQHHLREDTRQVRDESTRLKEWSAWR